MDDPNDLSPDDCPELAPRALESANRGFEWRRQSVAGRASARACRPERRLGLGHSGYPGVVFETDESNVGFLTDPRDFNLFARLACTAYDAQVEIQTGEGMPGAVVEVVARAGSLNRECPDAPSIAIPIPID